MPEPTYISPEIQGPTCISLEMQEPTYISPEIQGPTYVCPEMQQPNASPVWSNQKHQKTAKTH